MTATDSPLPADTSADLRAYKPLVRQIAGQLRAHLAGNVMSMDELVQAGLIGLNEALARFESGQGASFETYAARRIKGAMLDELRGNDSLARGPRARLREVAGAVQRLEHKLGRTPRSKEVAAELGWPLQKFHDCMAEAGGAVMRAGDVVLDHDIEALSPCNEDEDLLDSDPFDEQQDPQRAIQQRQRMAALHAAFDALDEIERYIMESLYNQGLDRKEVARTLGVSGPRVSQMSAKIVEKLRERMQGY